MNPEELERELLLRDSGELSAERLSALERLLASSPEHRETAEQFSAFNRQLAQSKGAEVPELDEFTRARILREAGKSKPAFRQWPFAAAAALAVFLLVASALRREPGADTAPQIADARPAPEDVRTLDADPFLTELDLLDLQLLELTETAWFDLNGVNPHFWDELDLPHLIEDSI
ncbi:MAG: hypothetical protein JJU29_02470 [Verrucomicrobia bacterium]|nr:hypothetical protein [Verrucomicrobiota bacterium]MCH8511201.1 hypothetical protein [Kiritimatiellia bacterium]